MAKRTQKRYTRSEKDHLGCISGLISIFDFRQGRATRRLISDRRCGNCEKHVGTAHSSVKPTLRASCDQRHEVSNTGVSTLLDGDESNNAEMGAMSVKVLMDEEMSKEQKPKKKLPNFSHLQTRKDLEHRGCIEEYLKHANRKSNLDPQPNTMEVYLLIEEFFNGNHYHLEIPPAQESFNTQPVQKHSILEEGLGEAMETFLNQKFVEAKQLNKGGALHQSKEFKDALEILNSNKDLFLELLQDPNSLLLKHIQDLRNSHRAKLSKTESCNELVVGPELSEQETQNSIECNREIISGNQFQIHRGHYKFFGRKDKLKDKSSTKGSDSCHISSGRIELLKPSPSSSQSQFSLLDIKRKIKNAIGESRKERHWIFMDKTSHKRHSSTDSEKVSHQNETTSKVSIDLLAGDKSEKTKECKSLQREPSIYKEAKKHLEKMLKVGEGDEDLSAKDVPSTLGTILSSPEYNMLSPRLSPGKGKELMPGTEQLRFSPNNSNSECNLEHVWQVKAECPSNDLSPLYINGQEGQHPYAGLQDSNFNSNFEDGFVENTTEESNSIRGNISPKAIEIKEVWDVSEQSNLFDVASEPDSSDVIEENVEEGSTECTRQIHCEENLQLLSIPEDSASPTFIHNTESRDTIYKELERQSPVSVLEPLFLDGDTSPTSHVTRQDESPIQSRRIHFDEHESSPLSETGMDREIIARARLTEIEHKSEYIRTVLAASDLSCDESKRGWNSTDQPLDPSSFDEMEAQPNQLSDDRKLLFCVVNEIILDIHERLFGCSSWVSFIKPRMRPIPVGEFFVREVMEDVDWYLLPPWPRSLDQIVEKDLAKDWTWMDHCFDVEEIGCDAGDAILDKLMEEMILELWD